ncbi:ATP-binding protein [Algoriphagus sp. D3-2-R+10]|uniref:sensor histidine kinase n=1 Tax=Algoriphagus aurantiacus TaxID=3103948 RepID=UPI002B3EB075|nr:ATP-binding protein [Algoriphagus sp. D3-2-R+10]MEB2776543.1 ATP-binding protein [Algoriphagus sp. D3-2-R+10]
MNQSYHLIFSYFYILSLIALATACQQGHEVPFPENPSQYQKPLVKPFEIPIGKPLKWNKIPSEKVPKPVNHPIDFSKLPSKPFDIMDFKPLKSPPQAIQIAWEDDEEIQLNLDTIPGVAIPVKKQLLLEPQITKLAFLSKSDLSNAGILRIGQTEGLIGNRVYAIVTDLNGIIWISTELGLSKFTGDQFENYNVLPRNPDGLIDTIVDLEIGNDGSLLILSQLSGVYVLDINHSLITNYQIGTQFARINEDDSGLFWLGNLSSGVHFLDPSTKKLHSLKFLSEQSNRTYAGVYQDKSKNLWFAMRGKIGVLNPERTSVKFISKKAGIEPSTFFYGFTESSTGEVWVSSFEESPIAISLGENTLTRFGPEQGFYGNSLSITFDVHNRAWITDNDTITLYDPEMQKIKKIQTGARFVTSEFPSATMTDAIGNVWIGTENTGVLLINPEGMLSQHFNANSGLVNDEVWGIEEGSNGMVWMATYEGINIYDPVKERIYLLKFPGNANINNHRSISRISDHELLLGSFGGFTLINLNTNTAFVYELDTDVARIAWKSIRDSNGNILLGTVDGVLKFSPDLTSLEKIDEFSGLASNRVWLIEEDKEGRIWLGNDIGVDIVDPGSGQVSYLSERTGLTSDYTSIMIKTHNGEMVIGGDAGFSIIDLSSSTITNLTPDHGLDPPVMYDMVEVGEGLHIGSDNGIIVARRPLKDDPRSMWRFYNYGKGEGFPFNDYNQATATYTSNGNVWWGAAPIMSVNTQVPKIDTLRPAVVLTKINIMDQNPDFLGTNFVKSLFTDEDSIWNTDHTAFYTKKDIPNDSSYLIQNQIHWDSVDLVSKMPVGLVLPFDQNSMNFSFMNQDVLGRDKIVYRYILQGEDKAWSEISARSTTQNYYNLLPGEYTFKVATRGFNGLWSEPASIKFTISPPWWQTWIAYVIFASLMAGFIYAIVQVRSKYLQKENRILEERVSHRTAQLKKSIDNLKNAQSQLVQSEKMASLGELTAGIAHEIQNPLNFVNNFSEVSGELLAEMREELEKGDIDEAKAISVDLQQNLDKINQHGKRADAIVKAMLQHSRVSGGNRVLTDINMLADEYFRLAYHGLRAKDKSFNSSMNTDYDPKVGQIELVAQELGRVLLNLINNAFYAVMERKSESKEGYEPSVQLTTKRKEDRVEITVKDNGKGIPRSVKEKIFQPFFTTKPTGQGTGLGLSISYDIVKAHGGEILVESKEGEGTEFCIRLPIDSQKHE